MPTQTVTAPAVEQETEKRALPPKKPIWHRVLILSVVLISAVILALIVFWKPDAAEHGETGSAEETVHDNYGMPEWVDVRLIRVDGASRRGEKLEGVRDIAVHYVANPGSSALANRNYFDSPDSETSSHFIVGLEGEVIMCVPLNEKSSATNERNRDTVSVEVCHPDATGEFSPVTRAALVRLLAWLCEKFELSEENLIRHYDVTGKMCPLYYVEHPEEWDALKWDVKEAMNTEF